MSFSVLQKAAPADVRSDPFPYIVIRNALPDALYSELARTLPSPALAGVDESANNRRWDYRTSRFMRDAAVPQLWKDFIAYHASRDFYLEMVRLFFDGIHRLYPKQFPSLAYMEKLRVGVRHQETFWDHDVLMEAMLSGNTPVREATSVRGTHIDQGQKLFSALFYMRKDEDDSRGGDLTISRFKPQYAQLPNRGELFTGSDIDDKYTEVVETVKYDRNVLVMFINSIDSLHGVTVREPTKHGRFFVNLVGDAVTKLYRIRRHPVYVEFRRPMTLDGLPPISVLATRARALRRRSARAD